MKLVVGLGNPGKKYEKTRHNVGFILLDQHAEDAGFNWGFEKKFNAEVTKDGDTIFAKPQTFMNKSGESVAKLVEYYDVKLGDLLIIHDDIDLDLGIIKKQKSKGDAGHKGVKSIISLLGTIDFWRLRVGVGRPENQSIDTEDWVLMNLEKDELAQIILTNIDL